MVGGAVAVLLVLSIYQIKAKAFWYDEAVSVTLVRLPLDQFLASVSGDEANGSLYYVFLLGWHLLGDSEARVRALSVLCVAGTVPLLYLIGRRHLGAASAVVGCVLFATSPFAIEYAQEARMYGLAMFMASAVVLSWSFATETDRVRWWVAYAAFAAASLYTHFFCGFVVLGLGITWLVGMVPRTRASIASQAVIVLAAIPIGIFVFGSGVSHVTWIDPFSIAGVLDVIGKFGGGLPALVILLYVCAIAAIPGGGVDHARRIAPVVAWGLAPLVVGIAVSLWASLLVPRYFIVALPAITLLAGAGIVRIGGLLGGSRWRLPIVTAAIITAVALSALPLANWYGQSRTGWRDAATWVSRTAREGDSIAYYIDQGRIPFGLYLKRNHDYPVDASLDELRVSTGRSWLVLSAIGKQQFDELHASLPGYRVVESKVFEDIRVQLVERP